MSKIETSYQPVPPDQAKEVIEQMNQSRVPTMTELAKKVYRLSGREMPSRLDPVRSENSFYNEIPPGEARRLLAEFKQVYQEEGRVPTPEEYYNQVINDINVKGLGLEKNNPALGKEIPQTLINVSQRLKEIIFACEELKENILQLCQVRLKEWLNSLRPKSADEKLMESMQSQALEKLAQAESADKEIVVLVVEAIKVLSIIKETAGQRDRMHEQSAIYFELAESLRQKVQLRQAENRSQIKYNEKLLRELSRFNIA